ncbi:MAG: hypothetical protein M1838_005116 [Thelocarpon superellum]|nr:MAG: hypothetical protein M1838_005116 [Thelocarpon superellum]
MRVRRGTDLFSRCRHGLPGIHDILLGILCLLALVNLGTSLTLRPRSLSHDPPSPQVEAPHRRSLGDAQPEGCGFVGNSDVYGLGIRVGIYLQWTGALIAKFYMPEKARDFLDIDTVFLVALLAAAATLSTTSVSTTYAVEILVLLHIFFGDTYVMLLDKTMRQSRLSVLGLYLRFFVIAAMTFFGLWYWYRGIDQFLKTPCGTSAFLFARVDLFGRARNFYTVLSTAHSAILILVLLGQILQGFRSSTAQELARMLKRYIGDSIRGRWVMMRGRDEAGMAAWQKERAFAPNYSRWLLYGFFYLGRETAVGDAETRGPAAFLKIPKLVLIPFVLAILSIELTLSWNNITGVYAINTTGQIIPFVIGIGGVGKALNDLLGSRYKGSKVLLLLDLDAHATEHDILQWDHDFFTYHLKNKRWVAFDAKTSERRKSV